MKVLHYHIPSKLTARYASHRVFKSPETAPTANPGSAPLDSCFELLRNGSQDLSDVPLVQDRAGRRCSQAKVGESRSQLHNLSLVWSYRTKSMNQSTYNLPTEYTPHPVYEKL
jgi:hypothetical protein